MTGQTRSRAVAVALMAVCVARDSVRGITELDRPLACLETQFRENGEQPEVVAVASILTGVAA